MTRTQQRQDITHNCAPQKQGRTSHTALEERARRQADTEGTSRQLPPPPVSEAAGRPALPLWRHLTALRSSAFQSHARENPRGKSKPKV